MNIPERRYAWTRLDLFRFSAATGNAHRIHYDVEHARSEGLDSVVVHTTLHAMMLWQTLVAVVDEPSIREFAWRNHGPLVADREVLVTGTSRAVPVGYEVELEARTVDDRTLVSSARATIVPPIGGRR